MYPSTESAMNRARHGRAFGTSSRHQGANAPACASIETLESRVFLSGNVLASVAGGNLRIRGDAEANAIVVDQVGLNAGQVRISGASGTAINGQAGPIVLDGMTR